MSCYYSQTPQKSQLHAWHRNCFFFPDVLALNCGIFCPGYRASWSTVYLLLPNEYPCPWRFIHMHCNATFSTMSSISLSHRHDCVIIYLSTSMHTGLCTRPSRKWNLVSLLCNSLLPGNRANEHAQEKTLADSVAAGTCSTYYVQVFIVNINEL